MVGQAMDSILIGAALSAAVFIPLLIFQYRRYGRFSASRWIWSVAAMIYLTALISYTLFPLPELTEAYCARRRQGFILDPTEYFREMAQRYRGEPLRDLLTSAAMLQMVLNLALFVPFGVLVRQLWRWRLPLIVLGGLGVSLLIELTQLTGNWGLSACQYRVADVNDLMTNTLGALIGGLIGLLLPRLAADPAYLQARRLQARPVTRLRRWTGMLLDTLILGGTGMVVGALVLAVWLYLIGDARPADAQALLVLRGAFAAAGLVCLLLVVLPALRGSGASLGQRIVYLEPLAPDHRPARRLGRALAVQGVLVVGVGFLPFQVAGWVLLWCVLDALAVMADPRGMSFIVAGCRCRDSRAAAEDPQDAAEDPQQTAGQ